MVWYSRVAYGMGPWTPRRDPLKGFLKENIGATLGYVGSILGFTAPMGPYYGPLPSLKGSGLWVPVLKLACSGVEMVYEDSEFEAHARGPCDLLRTIIISP